MSITTTEERKVIVFLDDYRIEGTIHLHFEQRLLDFINVMDINKGFFPMTEAKIYSLKNNQLFDSVEFISINREKVTLMFFQKKDEK
ncbi:hypothetical protein KAU39_05865 [bacterium]|nr:hypothetical protein [bacterium]